jgi:membrane fusion protein (multidrug efflux system)
MSQAQFVTEAAAPKAGSHRRALLISAAAALAFIAAAWVGIHWVTVGQYIETTDDAYVGGDVTDLAPQVSGVVTRVLVTDNQAVHQGDLLVQIDPSLFAAARDKAEAEIAADQASLANLTATRDLQASLIQEAQAQLAAAQAQAILASANQRRYAQLARSHAGTVQDSETGTANAAAAAAEVAKDQAALNAAQQQVAVIAAQTQQAQAALAGAEASLAVATLNLGYTQIRAPFDGVVGNRSAHEGGYASAGAPLLSIVPATGLWVDANFKEDQLARLKPGQPVSIIADILPGQKITGHVASIAPASGAVFSILPAENATGNFTKIVQRVPVRIMLDGTAGQLGLLRPGLSVTAEINTK